MNPTRYIGRVGALAAALGIGVALSTGGGLAWADGGDATGVSRSNDDGGGGGNGRGGSDRPSGPAHAKPQSALGDRIRKNVDATLDGRADAVKRIQSKVEKAQARLGDGRAKLEAVTTSAATPRVSLTDPKLTTGKAVGSQIVAGAIDAAPDLRLPERPDAVIAQAEQATKDFAQRAEDAATAPARNAPPSAKALSRDTAAPRQKAGKAEVSQIVPEAIDAVPDLRPGIEVVKVAEATKIFAQRATEAIGSARNALPSPTALGLDASPVTAFAAPLTATVSKSVEAPELKSAALMATLLAASGLSPLAGNGPLTPAPSPLALAVMAWARRESERTSNPFGTGAASDDNRVSTLSEDTAYGVAPMAAITAAWEPNPGLTAAPVISGDATAEDVGWTTGPNTNTAHWYIAGTDLGIMWDSGYTDPQTGKPVIYTLFGDTYSEPAMAGDWRNNVLLRSSDTDLSDGLQFSDALIHAGASSTDPGVPEWYSTSGDRAGAAQIIYDPGFNGLFGSTHTMIPTSAIAVKQADGSVTQYATVMSVRTWDNPGSWTTNYSAIAYSTDGGETWTVDPDTVRSSGWLRASTPYVPGDEHFQQNALVYGDPDDPNSYTGPADDPNREPYVYVYGTPSGRQGSAYVARVPESQLTDLDSYQYWAGEKSDGTGDWVTGDPSAAVPVIGASQDDLLMRLYDGFDTFTFGWFSKILNGIWVGGLPTGGNVSEMSVQYNEHLQRYVVTYTDGGNNVVMRVSDSPQGSWSNSTTLVRNTGVGQNTGMYAPMIHPLSGTSALGSGNEKYLYFNLSQWDDYNVRMMRADMDNLTIT
jgi:Domain of unknown function (DUF4185)